MEQEKICLDTDFVIGLIKDHKLEENFSTRYQSSKVYITTINIFELFLRLTNLDEIYNFLDKVNVLSFDKKSSVLASEIYKNLKANGNLIDYRDIFIASAAIANDCTLATLNTKHFERIKDLKLLKKLV